MKGLTKLANHLTVFYLRIITRDTFHVPGIYDTHYTGVCMLCKETPSREKTVTCITCVMPWHMNCLENPPVTLTSVVNFKCPYCAGVGLGGASLGGELVAKIREIEADISMTEEEKSRKRQDIVSGKQLQINENENENEEAEDEERDVLALLGESIKCPFCYMLPDRPVTTSCGHNFCLKCFKKWIGQGKETCVKCRSQISRQMINQPLINSALVTAIRMAKESRKNNAPRRPQAAYPQANQEDRPDNPFIREGAAKRAGMANASSGRIFVAIPSDHFGPILAENDPERNQGILVGDSWTHRLNCRQWGVHWPHVAGIAGQAKYGAQSVVLSGGYEDDEDHGEWFLYTGSGGRDLSGNKRTNKDQSFDQLYTNSNEALRVSCKQGYPVRVVRSHKEKRSSYAPQEGLRYDGVYRIDKCWRKLGKQGYKMCRYLFVRCDNEPAPWTSDGHGDKPRPLPEIPELEEALDIFERTDTPSWDYDDGEDKWKWKKPPPPSQQRVIEGSPKDGKRARKTPKKLSLKQTLLKGFSCVLCKNVLTQPVTTLCAHNFCKGCLEEAFKGQAFVKERECHNGRKLRSKKNFMKCPSCSLDISEFLQNPQVNRELEDAIGKLQEEFHESDNDKEDVK
ncbi:E3 ubiquitin-protein ligase ORTHRUS 2-like isoform X2 [Lycium ferocissimum]|uniref:E3 ubiquitin-protein ligase ORTHRUS 2-like isoform X2 n=1 Tax=Lycium ferocissimum TaxID=112874 RepID=UPI002815B32D|nr:E3 ubiquitin-protein ligase ORTHRUS 2-like isoform X2 [Lycium ferocissimum]XP_059289293.1 E3 ubiquitin-protein ligase ORTHRUS 2-like isoform X2 [Lycium ferocissimum]